MRSTVLLFTILGMIAADASAQAWTQEDGAARLTLSFGMLSADQRYDFDGTLVTYDEALPEDASPAYWARSFAVSGEYGIGANLTAFAKLPLRLVHVLRPDFNEAVELDQVDLGDLTLGLRLGLQDRLGLPEGSALAINFGLHVPMGYRRNVVPAIGSGQVDADLVVSFGQRFLNDAAHAEASAGYRFRSGIYTFSRLAECPSSPPDDVPCFRLDENLAFSDELVFGTQVGYELLGRFLLRGLADVVWSVEQPQAVERYGGAFQPALFQQRRWVQLGGGLTAALFEGSAVSVAFMVPVSGNNALDATGVTFGIEIRL